MKIKDLYKSVIALFVLIMLIIACDDSGKNKPELLDDKITSETKQNTSYSGKEYFVGDRVKLGDVVLTVKKIKDCVSSNEFIQPEKGFKYVEADILIENAGNEPVGYNGLDFTLQDNEGYSYNNTFGGCSNPSLSAGTLQRGQKSRGFVTFEIPKSNKAEQITFTPDFWSDEQIIVKIR